MTLCRPILLLTIMLIMSGCIAPTKVAVMDRGAIGQRNINIILEPRVLEDDLNVASILQEEFMEYGILTEIKTGDNVGWQGGSGSAFVVADGYWVTNQHVTDEIDPLTVSVAGKDSPGKVIAEDDFLDLAIIKAHTGNLKPFSITEPKLGREIYAIGFPLSDVLGRSPKITSGIVSSLSGLEHRTNEIQISAPIQPGNSGGPVINTEWSVVGVAVRTYTGGTKAIESGVIPQGVNYAVSANALKGFLLQNGIKTSTENNVSSVEEAIASTGLVWNGASNSNKRTYYLQYGYGHYWDFGNNISHLNLSLVDMRTGDIVMESKTNPMYGMGIKIPVRNAVKEVVNALGLAIE